MTVAEVQMSSRVESVLFRYTERNEAAGSRNFWDEHRPSVALSPDRTTVAYAAEDGLYILDRGSGVRRVLIARTTPEVGEARAPMWRPPVHEDTWALYSPHWSADGRYLSVELAHYEGSTFGLFDLRTNRFFSQAGLPFSYADPALGSMGWSLGKAATIVPANGSHAGVYLSALNDPAHASFVAVRTAEAIGEAALSADAQRMAFAFAAGPDVGHDRLGVANRDGSALRTIDTEGSKSSLAFDLKGNLFWVEAGGVKSWNGASRTSIATVDPTFEWHILSTDGDRIELAGYADASATFAVLDAGDGRQIYEHDSPTDFTTYLGII